MIFVFDLSEPFRLLFLLMLAGALRLLKLILFFLFKHHLCERYPLLGYAGGFEFAVGEYTLRVLDFRATLQIDFMIFLLFW